MDSQAIGQRFKAFLEQKGLSYARCAQLAGINKNAVGRIANADEVNLSQLVAVVATFDELTYEWLLHGTENREEALVQQNAALKQEIDQLKNEHMALYKKYVALLERTSNNT